MRERDRRVSQTEERERVREVRENKGLKWTQRSERKTMDCERQRNEKDSRVRETEERERQRNEREE